MLALLGFAILIALALPTSAEVIVTEGLHSAVVVHDRAAYFDSVVSEETDLRSYEEDGLAFFADGVAHISSSGIPGMIWPGYFYPGGASTTFTSIATVDGGLIPAIEFNASGAGENRLVNIFWEAYRDELQTGSGKISIQDGNFIGFEDHDGFHELRVGAYFDLDVFSDMTSFEVEDPNRIHIDTVRAVVVPEASPLSMTFLGASILILFGRLRRRSGARS